MKRLVAVIIGLGIIPVALAAQAPEKKPAPAKAPASAPRVSLLSPALHKEKAPETYKVKFTTTKGDCLIEVTRAWAPGGADRFYNLVKNGFFDGASFFRVLPGFVVQFGISPQPAVAKAWSRAVIPDDPVKQSNLRGSLTFATAGRNTRTTQIFINLADNARLDSMGFSPFGKVLEGMEVVNQFYSGYGEGVDQGRLTNEGQAFVSKEFARLDIIKSATIVK